MSDPLAPASSRRLRQTVHVLAIVSGSLTIVAGSASLLGLPAPMTAGLGVLVAVLTYIANQLPSLGSD